MPGLFPNRASVAFAAQADLDSVDLELLQLAQRRYGVLSGCAVTAQATPNGTLAVAAGVALVGGRKVTVTAGNVTPAAGDATNPRFDLIAIDNTGGKVVIAGTAASTPVFPAVPALRTVIAALYVPAGDTVFNADQIVDKRVIVPEPAAYFSSDYGVLGDGATDNTTALQAWIDAGRLSFHDVTKSGLATAYVTHPIGVGPSTVSSPVGVGGVTLRPVAVGTTSTKPIPVVT